MSRHDGGSDEGPSPRILGVVLAGGQSQRMGSDKASLTHPIDARLSWLAHAIEQVSRVTKATIVSGESRNSIGVPFVSDHRSFEGSGPMGGVITTLLWAKKRDYAGCLYLPVDMPLVDHFLLESIIVNAKRIPKTCVVARSTGLDPLLAYYPVTLVDALEISWNRDHRSLRRWLEDQFLVSVLVSREKTSNVNTPKDLHKLRSVR
ncbi:MAG: molybdenum cofactor guanylyltransferase [Planctomycetota bacterium]